MVSYSSVGVSSEAKAEGLLSATVPSGNVQCALVNLIARPVVLVTAAEQVTLWNVLSLLHHPLGDEAAITIIRPRGRNSLETLIA